jgi:hypothetical protein
MPTSVDGSNVGLVAAVDVLPLLARDHPHAHAGARRVEAHAGDEAVERLELRHGPG